MMTAEGKRLRAESLAVQVPDASMERKATAVRVTVASNARHGAISRHSSESNENAATRAVSMSFHENGVAFDAVRSLNYLEIIRAIRSTGQDLTQSGYNALRTNSLDGGREMSAMCTSMHVPCLVASTQPSTNGGVGIKFAEEISLA
eukprot:347961-Chlamydomonas_euryale.AAC.1